MYPVTTHSLVIPAKEAVLRLIVFCHPGEGRDPSFCNLLLLITFPRPGEPGGDLGVEPWIPASAGMTMGGLS
jgi:hypothetical protein